MTTLDRDKAVKFGEVAVHAVQAFDGDQDAPVVAPHAGEHFVQRGPVVMREDKPLGAA